MSASIVEIVVYFVTTISALAVVHYLILFFRHPKEFRKLWSEPSWSSYKKCVPSAYLNSGDDPAFLRYALIRKFLYSFHLLLVSIGLFAALYISIRTLFSWMPHSIADGLASILGFYGVISLLAGFDSLAKKLVAYEHMESLQSSSPTCNNGSAAHD